MIEMLAVLAILAVVLTVTLGVSGGITGSRGMTGVHQIAAACDAARARAMKEQREVMLAFATDAAGAIQDGRAVLMCWVPPPDTEAEALSPEEEQQRQRDGVLEPLSEWIYLPEGHVFAELSPSSATAGVNLLTLPNTQRKVWLPGGTGTVSMPCLGFGSLGEVVFPEVGTAGGASLLIAIAENAGKAEPSPRDCRWIGIQWHSGASMILP